MTSTIQTHLSTVIPYLPVAATTLSSAIGVMIAVVGLRALTVPSSYLTSFGLPLSPSTPFIPLVGIRNVFHGSSILLFHYLGDKRAMGVMLLWGGIVPFADGVAVWKFGNQGDRSKAWEHLNSAIGAVVLGGYLFYLGLK